jgi:hypothetical protein
MLFVLIKHHKILFTNYNLHKFIIFFAIVIVVAVVFVVYSYAYAGSGVTAYRSSWTDWKFCLRLASSYGAMLFASASTVL